jgi:hypothetical protein
VAYYDGLGNTWADVLQMLSEQFGLCGCLAGEHRANWLTRDTENAFLQTRLKLSSIEDILAVDAGPRTGRETDALFDCSNSSVMEFST